jgi:predicted nucleic acid-binding Zn ribbon protein
VACAGSLFIPIHSGFSISEGTGAPPNESLIDAICASACELIIEKQKKIRVIMDSFFIVFRLMYFTVLYGLFD